jgi:hypothetical protein
MYESTFLVQTPTLPARNESEKPDVYIGKLPINQTPQVPPNPTVT